MAATGARIEPYSYSDGTSQWQSTHTLGVSIGGVASVRHPTPMRLEDALASWQGLLDVAKPAGAPWALSYSSTTRRVTIASAGAVFSAIFPANVGPWLGFTAGTLAGQSTYTGDSAPAGLVQCAALSTQMGEIVERGDQVSIRHGRSYAYTWGKLDSFTVEAWIDRSRYPWQVGTSLDSTDPSGGWATCGRIRLHQTGGNANAYSETYPSGYVDGFVTRCDIKEESQTTGFLRVDMEVVSPSQSTGIAEPTGLWGSLRYGWQPIYWLTISGIPVTWVEKTTGLVAPTDHPIESPLLQIDDSAAVGSTIDRSRGLGAGLPLGFMLRDGTMTAALIARPAYSTHLSANVSAVAASVPAITAGWPASGAAYMGLETFTYTNVSGSAFTPADRGEYGSLATAHRTAKASQAITSAPRVWTGRDVRLYALACDPTGTPTGSNIADDSIEVWRGRIEGNALRQVGGWQFTAQALDRVLERKLAGKVTGKVIGFGTAVKVYPTFKIRWYVKGLKSNLTDDWGPYDIKAVPFAAYSSGQVISRSEAIYAIVAAWSAAVTAVAGASTYIDTTLQVDTVPSATGGNFTIFRPVIQTNPTTYYITHLDSQWGNQLTLGAAIDLTLPVNVQAADASVLLGWSVGNNPLQLWTPGSPSWEVPSAPIVQIDEGAFDLVDTSGYLQFSGKTKKHLVKYTGYTELSGQLFFTLDLEADASFTVNEIAGATVAVWSNIGPLSLELLMLTTIQSSGAGSTGTYDTAAQGSGYAIDAVNALSFTLKSGQTALEASISTAGTTFADVFSGALALSQQAVVQRDVDGACQLALVDAAPYGSDYTSTITDYHLLHLDGDPIGSIERLNPPNAIEYEIITGAEDDAEPAKGTAYDVVSIGMVGQITESYRIPAESRQQLVDMVTVRSAAIFASQPDAQAVTIHVVPWTVGEPGDLVRFVCTWPGLWSYASGAPGYSGNARVTGRTMELKTGEVTLTLLLEGQAIGRSLSPSMEVVAYDVAGAATWIDVPLQYLDHMTAALTAAGGAVTLLHYTPGGTEGTSQRYSISAAALNAGYCRLTVASQTGVFSLTTVVGRSHLTLPATGAAYSSTYQDGFAHVDDGSSWL